MRDITNKLQGIGKDKVVFLLAIIAGLGLLLAIHGLLPNMVVAQTTYISSLGSIECGTQQPLQFLQAKCTLTGGSEGTPIPQAMPFYVPAIILMRVLSVNLVPAYCAAAALTMLFALYGAYKLFSYATSSRYLALFGGLMFLLSPFILGIRNFGGTYWAFMLMPLMIYVSWRLVNANIAFSGRLLYRRLTLLTLAWGALSIAILFLDGYAFVMWAISTYLMLGAQFLRSKNKSSSLIRAGLVFAGLIMAYGLYTVLLPTGSFGKSSLAVFRAMGLDVATLLIPTNNTLLASLFNMGVNWSDLWGDGSNTNNYVGIFLFIISAIGIYYSVKRTKLSVLKLAVIAIGISGFILSLGPAIKIDSEKPANTTFTKSYEMPFNAAIPNIPVAVVDKTVPGFSTMRATYRWFVLGEIALIFFAVVGLDTLLKARRGKILLAILVTLIAIDIMPNPGKTVAANIKRHDQNQQFNREVIYPLKKLVRPEEKALIYPGTPGNNDFLANYMAPLLDVYTYNLADDKAVNHARKTWPGPVSQLLQRPDLPLEDKVRLIGMTFEDKHISLLIIPKFDLRWDSYSWPPEKQYPDREELVQALDNDPAFSIQEHERFLVVRKSEE